VGKTLKVDGRKLYGVPKQPRRWTTGGGQKRMKDLRLKKKNPELRKTVQLFGNSWGEGSLLTCWSGS